ncbi:hypothetical protein OIU84_023911 [Salix udensis]|uniref:Uncharacterized protein n=1 Tax=Salix udensis TaxID=889485 RepID=A0AAD6J678_9ROSI|nr:hypothetical protein OIU84_023911 [Salix udensis]
MLLMVVAIMEEAGCRGRGCRRGEENRGDGKVTDGDSEDLGLDRKWRVKAVAASLRESWCGRRKTWKGRRVWWQQG